MDFYGQLAYILATGLKKNDMLCLERNVKYFLEERAGGRTILTSEVGRKIEHGEAGMYGRARGPTKSFFTVQIS